MLYIDFPQEADSAAKHYKPIDSGLFTFGGWKFAPDGGLAGRTPLFCDKSLFASEISYPYHPLAELDRMVQVLHNTGLQVGVHVGGDQGIDMTRMAFENTIAANPRADPRFRIEHGLFPTASAIQRMKAHNIILSTQPLWITWYGDGFTETTSALTMNQLLPLKTMLDMGIHLAFGCDVPASPYQEPRWAFKGAAYRRSVAGSPFISSERLTMPEALRIHTMGAAYAGFAEKTTGSLELGNFADLMSVPAHVELDIYNKLGEKVYACINEKVGAGAHSVLWNGIDDSGKKLSAGVYVYRMKTKNCTASRKMILLQ